MLRTIDGAFGKSHEDAQKSRAEYFSRDENSKTI
jgi:hypothetical protein